MIFGSDYLTVLNPDFVTDLVKEYLLYDPTEPVQQGQALPPGMKRKSLKKESNCHRFDLFISFSLEASFINSGARNKSLSWTP